MNYESMLMFKDFSIFSFGSRFNPWNGPVLGKFGRGPYEEHLGKFIWAPSRENLSSGACEQQRRRPACTSMQTQISAFVIRLLESIISRPATSEISIF